MIRHHFGVGDISNVIYAADFSLDRGLGSNDNIHLARLMKQTIYISETIWASTADKQYPSYRNFVEAQKLGLKLFIPEKANEGRLGDNWPEHAREMRVMERERPDEFHE